MAMLAAKTLDCSRAIKFLDLGFDFGFDIATGPLAQPPQETATQSSPNSLPSGATVWSGVSDMPTTPGLPCTPGMPGTADFSLEIGSAKTNPDPKCHISYSYYV